MLENRLTLYFGSYQRINKLFQLALQTVTTDGQGLNTLFCHSQSTIQQTLPIYINIDIPLLFSTKQEKHMYFQRPHDIGHILFLRVLYAKWLHRTSELLLSMNHYYSAKFHVLLIEDELLLGLRGTNEAIYHSLEEYGP